MKINKLLTAGSLGMILAPVASVISCGSPDIDLNKTILVQAEKGWSPFYKKIISEFKKNEKELMKKNGIEDIKIKEMGTFDVGDALQNKGLRDESVPDLFLVASDRIQSFLNNKWLKKFNAKDANDFLAKHTQDSEIAQGKDRSFVDSTKAIQEIALNDKGLYGVPENVEAMVEFYDKDSDENNVKPVTKLSDLWFSAGFFNIPNTNSTGSSNEKNLRDIVWNDNGTYKTVLNGDGDKKDGSTILTKNDAEQIIENGFKKVVDIAKDKGINQDAFQKDSGKANDSVREYMKDNKTSTSIYDGPWAVKDLTKLLGNTPKAKAPNDWNQWGGGYTYSMNGRISEKKQKVIEELISYFYHTKYAKEMFNEINKLTPIIAGQKELQSTSEIAKAVYGAKWLPKPVDQAFSKVNVWDAYSTIMSNNKSGLSSVTTSDSTKLVNKLKGEFIKAIQDKVKSENDKNQ